MLVDKNEPYRNLTNSVDEYNLGALSFDMNELCTVRDKIALSLFYFTDTLSNTQVEALKLEYDRKQNFAIRKTYWCSQTNERTGKLYTVALAEEKARIDNKEKEDLYVEAYRKALKSKSLHKVVSDLLNSVSSRINNLKTKI